MRTLITVLSCLGMLAIPAVIFTGALGALSYPGFAGLAAAWVILLWACAWAGEDPARPSAT